MAFMGFWGTGVEPGTQYTEKVSCTVWKMMMMMILNDYLLRIARASMRDVTIVILNSLK